jgi:FAD:protein FMN transferase
VLSAAARIRLTLCPPEQMEAARVAEAAIPEVRRIEFLYSRSRPDSPISHMNGVAKTAGTVRVDDETADLIDRGVLAHSRSDGLFDVTSGLLRPYAISPA